MPNSVDKIVQIVSEWNDVTIEPHRFGGREFKIGNVEIGHIHNHGLVDVPFTRRIREQLVAENAAQVHHILPESGWISFYVRSDKDVDQAVWLYRLSYLQKQRNRRRGDRAAFERELNDLALSPDLRAIFA